MTTHSHSAWTNEGGHVTRLQKDLTVLEATIPASESSSPPSTGGAAVALVQLRDPVV